MSTENLFVLPLNKAPEGPYDPVHAVAATASHIFAPDAERIRIRDEILAGAPGPWHIVYGFQSVTIQRGKPN